VPGFPPHTAHREDLADLWLFDAIQSGRSLISLALLQSTGRPQPGTSWVICRTGWDSPDAPLGGAEELARTAREFLRPPTQPFPTTAVTITIGGQTTDALLETDGAVCWTTIALPAARGRIRIDFVLSEPHSTIELLELPADRLAALPTLFPRP
jgi:hypothetical protein